MTEGSAMRGKQSDVQTIEDCSLGNCLLGVQGQGFMAEMQSPANALLFIVILLWGVPLSLFASLLSLHQFKVLSGLLANLAAKRYKNDLWRAIRPCEHAAPLAVLCVHC